MTFALHVEPRLESRPALAIIPPIIAIAVTIVGGAFLLAGVGVGLGQAIYFFFIAPFSSLFNIAELLLKMGPLLLIAQALAIGFRARVWNIGAEGQLILGAVGGALLPIYFSDAAGVWMLPAMALLGALFGMAWAAIAAFLRAELKTNEILVTLMLNSIALQLLFYLVSGPLRDPFGFNFPQSAPFPYSGLLPTLIEGTRANISVFAGLAATLAAWILMQRSYLGFRFRAGGVAPAAAHYAGYSEKGAVWTALLIGGAAAGLAGVFEVAGPLGQLQRSVTPGYGFAAIIVAFLGGLNPIGILFAAFFMAVIYVGGDIAQTSAGVPYTVNTLMQGLLLASYIGARVFVDYRVRRARPRSARAADARADTPGEAR